MWRAIAPILVAGLLALLPAPDGLSQHAWYYFAIFSGVVVGLVLEPLPGGAIGLIGVVVVAVLAPFVLYGPEELARPGFNPADAALAWALSGFSNGTVWLIFAAFMFALAYDKCGLGRRIALSLVKRMGKSSLQLGYAIVAAETVLAPVTASSTARSGGTIYPVIRNVPGLYGSKPNDPSARMIGSYIMWLGVSASAITSSLFLTALAPNLLAVEIVRRTVNIEIDWLSWFAAIAPVGVLLLLTLPLLVYWFYPPGIKHSEEVAKWADRELATMGTMSAREIIVAALVTMALVLWIFGGRTINATTVALVVVAAMILTRVFTWDDMLKHTAAWNTLAWFATLVTLADGLSRVGFVTWFAETIAGQIVGVSPTVAMIILIAVFFFAHYLFASITAHTTAMLPVMLAVGATIPEMPMREYALLLCLTLGIMSVVSPYASGVNTVYYGSGYLSARDFWRLGGIFGVIFITVFLVVGVPWVLMTG
ncbi:MAG: anion permease [Alphaproteobacteria bacterium]|nr:anion permease [Alphaproteobacteria bacterium]